MAIPTLFSAVDEGQTVTYTVLFKKSDGSLYDPSVVVWSDGAKGSATVNRYTRVAAGPDTQIVKDSTGTYHVQVTHDRPGDINTTGDFRWYERMVGQDVTYAPIDGETPVRGSPVV